MTVYEAPINRDVVDVARPLVRFIAGVSFVGFSAGATVAMGAAALTPWLGDTVSLGGIADRYWAAALLALVLFVGQLMNRGKNPGWYAGFLLVDASFTSAQLVSGLLIYVAMTGLPPVVANLVAWVIGTILGVVIARYGEDLLFGAPVVKKKGTRA
jgi:pimeloyl-ACP methyl ester carboxylesterase